MYSFKSRVRYSELAQDGQLSLGSLVDLMQDCACFEAEDLGIGTGTGFARKQAWILNFWQIEIDARPGLGEEMTIATQACGSEKMFGYRNFMLTDGQGGSIARAYSIWTMIDLERGKLKMIDPKDMEIYGMAEPIPMEPVPRKIPVPEQGGMPQTPFSVREYHLDTNHHVNNAQFIRMATAYLPEEFHVGRIYAEYRRQAVSSDQICPVLYEIPDGYLVVFLNRKGKAYATVKFLVRKGDRKGVRKWG